MGFKEKREFSELENAIAQLETRKVQVEQQLAGGELPHADLISLSEELGKILLDLEKKGDRWLELSEMD